MMIKNCIRQEPLAFLHFAHFLQLIHHSSPLQPASLILSCRIPEQTISNSLCVFGFLSNQIATDIMGDRDSSVPDCTTSVTSDLEAAVLSHEDETTKASRDQSTFFRSVEEGNVNLLQILLKNRAVDINGYNDQGMTALHLSVYKFETVRKLDVMEILLKQGANVCLKAATPPQASKISIARHDSRSHSNILVETKRINVDRKTPLLLALELKSVLYLRGWEYRHWDLVLKLLSKATWTHLSEKGVHEASPVDEIPDVVRQGWNSVFQSGKHDLVQLCAEGKDITALKLLLSGVSKKLKMNLEAMAACHSNTLELKDTSLNVAKAMVKFIYTGAVDPEFMGHKGIELFLAADKYGVESLKALCEAQIKPTQENWIKMLTAAIESDSEVLALKCAKSIENVMEQRHEAIHILKKSFSESGHAGPNQMFHEPHGI